MVYNGLLDEYDIVLTAQWKGSGCVLNVPLYMDLLGIVIMGNWVHPVSYILPLVLHQSPSGLNFEIQIFSTFISSYLPKPIKKKKETLKTL